MDYEFMRIFLVIHRVGPNAITFILMIMKILSVFVKDNIEVH